MGFTIAVWQLACIDCGPEGLGPECGHAAKHHTCTLVNITPSGSTIAGRHPAYVDCGPGGSGPNNDHAAQHYACTLVYLPLTFSTPVSAHLVWYFYTL